MVATTLLDCKTALVIGGAGELAPAIARTVRNAGAQGTVVDLDVPAGMGA